MKFPAPLPVDANGVYHGLEFDNAGTNAIRIYLAAQFLESDWVNTVGGYDSYARDGDFFATLAGQLAAQEPCLQNVTGEALFWMYDKMIVKYGQVWSMMASRRGHVEETKLMKFAAELFHLDESFLEAKLKAGDRLEATERRRAEKFVKLYPWPVMDTVSGMHYLQAFGGHWPPRDDQVAPAPRQKQGQGQAQRARQGETQAQGQGKGGGSGGGGNVLAGRSAAIAAAAEGRRQAAAVGSVAHTARIAKNAAQAVVATAHAATAVTPSGPSSIRTASATPARGMGPVRNVGAGTRTAPIFIDEFDEGEGQVVAPPASARAAAKANAARPY
ncbi:MAG: hypothetical protein JOS17DRAFT_744209 [Linnemannia elongata]|nr:MAG: hypothetical protein JOS17DRAFT_744209 [Linnemannia elongata]